jgi:hypothetical protein
VRKSILRYRVVLLSLSVLVVGVLAEAGVASADTIYHPMAPTFVGPAATGCGSSGCSLLTGPVTTASTASASSASTAAAAAKAGTPLSGAHALAPTAPPLGMTARSDAAGSLNAAPDPTPMIPTVRCQPLGAGCASISTSAGGAKGAKGLNAVDSASLATNPLGDIEPADQGLCAGNGYVVETNNIGEILVFNTALKRQSAPIPLDTVMGLTSRAWSSGGDPSCEYDSSNGGHWFFTEIVSKNPEASGGAFKGCFAGVANECSEGIAVSQGSSPFGPYNVYYLNADYNPAEPGYPSLLNDFAKIGVTRDAFLLFYDEFPLVANLPGFGGGIFNGAQEFAFDKNALEQGRPVTLSNGRPNPNFNVAHENMGLLPTPDGNCDGSAGGAAGVTCWVAVIPAQPADAGQYDNHNGGTGFMMGALDFTSFAGVPSVGDNRMAVWDWTGLSNLNSSGCGTCRGVNFGGELFTGTNPYYNPETPFGVGFLGPQKAGPIPLAEQCTTPAVGAASQPCPEGGIETNGDFFTQVSQAQGQLWSSMSTEVNQTFGTSSEIHAGAVYWVVDTGSFDTTGQFMITNQGYVSAAHEDLEMPAMAAEGTGGNGNAIMDFTLNGNGGPTGADKGGFYPSTAYGRLTASSLGLTGSKINIADLGKSPQDGFTEYAPFPSTPNTNPPRPRWGDYSWAIYLPGGGDRIYFATNYIQSPNCTGKKFTLTIGTCGGTRDGLANWGTSVNYVVP